MRSLASLFGGETKDERAVDRGGVGRSQIPGDNNVRLVFGGNKTGRLTEHVSNHPAGDVLDVDHALAEIGIINGAKGATILLRHLMKRVFDTVSLFLKIAEDFIDECAVFNHQRCASKIPRILGSDGVGNSLLDFKQFGARQ